MIAKCIIDTKPQGIAIMFRNIYGSKRFFCESAKRFQEQQLIPQLNNIQAGIPNVISKDTLSSYWKNRALYHLDNIVLELNKTAENPVKIETITEEYLREIIDSKILTSSGRQLFLNASLLSNIVFSLKTLSLTENAEHEISRTSTPNLYHLIVQSFGSIKEFESVLTNSANSISGDGFSWLLLNIDNMGDNFVGDKSYTSIFDDNSGSNDVSDGNDSDKMLLVKPRIHSLKVVNTYNGGSPHFFQKNNGIFKRTLQYMEMKTELSEIEKTIAAKLEDDITNREISSKDSSMNESGERSLEKLRAEKDRINFLLGQQNRGVPVLGIDSSPKVWLLDHGIEGKKLFLKNLIKSTNWNLVEERLVQSLKQ